VLARDGKLYTTVLSGNILRMNPDGSAREVFANTGGRVLGFDFDAAGNLIAADAVKGLLSISPDRKITVLTDARSMAIRSAMPTRWWWPATGKIYLSDASTRFAPGACGAAPSRPACWTSSNSHRRAASWSLTRPPARPGSSPGA
jgi:sugar lactone lactonase YvrE